MILKLETMPLKYFTIIPDIVVIQTLVILITKRLPNPTLSCSVTVVALFTPNRRSLEVDVITIFISNVSAGSKIPSSTTPNNTPCDITPVGMTTSTLRVEEPRKV